jgi:hypothetical protein
MTNAFLMALVLGTILLAFGVIPGVVIEMVAQKFGHGLGMQ